MRSTTVRLWRCCITGNLYPWKNLRSFTRSEIAKGCAINVLILSRWFEKVPFTFRTNARSFASPAVNTPIAMPSLRLVHSQHFRNKLRPFSQAPPLSVRPPSCRSDDSWRPMPSSSTMGNVRYLLKIETFLHYATVSFEFWREIQISDRLSRDNVGDLIVETYSKRSPRLAASRSTEKPTMLWSLIFQLFFFIFHLWSLIFHFFRQSAVAFM